MRAKKPTGSGNETSDDGHVEKYILACKQESERLRQECYDTVERYLRSPQKIPHPFEVGSVQWLLEYEYRHPTDDHKRVLLAWSELSGIDVDVILRLSYEFGLSVWGELKFWAEKEYLRPKFSHSAEVAGDGGDLKWTGWYRKAEWRRAWGENGSPMSEGTFRRRLRDFGGQTNPNNKQECSFPVSLLIAKCLPTPTKSTD